MTAYIARRLLLIIPTLLGILLINFLIVQAAPGGPVERMIAQLQGLDTGGVMSRIGATASHETGGSPVAGSDTTGHYRGAQGLDPDLIADIEKLYGFDKPAHERFLQMLGNYLSFDFGESFFRDASVIDLVLDKMPVS